MKPFICLITGPAGVGKSTIAESLCKKFAKTARIDVDYIRHMIRSGKVKPFPSTDESKSQIELATTNACDLAKNFNKKGFSVFIDDVVVSERKLEQYINLTQGYVLHVFLLMCNKECLKQRDQGRPEDIQMGERSMQLHDDYKERIGENRWILVDTSNQSVGETVEEIKRNILNQYN